MAVPAWPATLPTYAQQNGFSVGRERAIAEFVPDVGRPIRRPRQSRGHELLTSTYIMTEDQLDDFLEFWEDDLKFGSLSFTMPHPRTQATMTAEMLDAEPPVAPYQFDDTYAVTLRLRVLS